MVWPSVHCYVGSLGACCCGDSELCYGDWNVYFRGGLRLYCLEDLGVRLQMDWDGDLLGVYFRGRLEVCSLYDLAAYCLQGFVVRRQADLENDFLETVLGYFHRVNGLDRFYVHLLGSLPR